MTTGSLCSPPASDASAIRASVIRALSRANTYLDEEVKRFTEREDAFLAVVTYLAAGGSPGMLGIRPGAFERYASFQDLSARGKALEVADLFGSDRRQEVEHLLWPPESSRLE